MSTLPYARVLLIVALPLAGVRPMVAERRVAFELPWSQVVWECNLKWVVNST